MTIYLIVIICSFFGAIYGIVLGINVSNNNTIIKRLLKHNSRQNDYQDFVYKEAVNSLPPEKLEEISNKYDKIITNTN